MSLSEEQIEKLVVDPGYISPIDFSIAKELSREKEIPLDRLLVQKGYIDDENLGKIIADFVGYPFINLKKANIEEISDELLGYIPESVASSQRAVIFKEEGGTLFLATDNFDGYDFVKHLEKITGLPIEVYYATSSMIDAALRKYGGDLQKEARNLIEEVKQSPEKGEQIIVKLAGLIFEHAYSNIASDIHVEPLEDKCIIRFRVDGALYKVLEYPKDIHDRLVARIKIISRLRTDERAAPQDGRFDYNVGSANIDVRVSILPTTEGENVVMRLLMQQGKRFNLDGLGLLEKDLKKIRNNAKKPWGMILVVGPTGSGKTTTLYAVLQMLHVSTVNIMTVEDPVEYNIDGVQQTQVNAKKNVTFSAGLRAIVRQDPDIIMVGEIRDEETVNMAIDAAMTGHLVLSTMHANDAATAFPRLLEMGVEPFLISSAVNVSIAQRLVRRVCEHCRESYFLTEEDVESLSEDKNLLEMTKAIAGKSDIQSVRFFRGKGCDLCGNTGYEGRTSIFEVLEVTEDLRKMIIEKHSSDSIRMKAIEEGMTSMVYDGISKALLGVTTIDEVKKAAKS
jgi:type IV pilus assembly protein PilB